MKKKYATLIIAMLSISCSEKDPSIDYEKIHSLVNILRSEDSIKISDIIDFPLQRSYPISQITDSEEFIKRYDEVLDKSIIKNIVSKNIIRYWKRMGWRGVMFDNGEIWLSEDYKIKSISFKTAISNSKLKEIIQRDKESLPEAYRNFEMPFIKLEYLDKYLRIDKNEEVYRLIIYKESGNMDVIENGKLEFDGNIGFYHIDWNIGNEVLRISYYEEDGCKEYVLEYYPRSELEVNIDAIPISKEIAIRSF